MFKQCFGSCSIMIFITFGAFFNLFGCSKNFTADEENRSKIMADWLNAAGEVVRKINDHEVIGVFNLLAQNVILGAPNKQGVEFIEGGKNDNWVVIVPLLEKDKDVGDQWNKFFSRHTAAHFVSEIRAIIVKDYVQYSSTGKALAFLHESFHAVTFMVNSYEQQGEKEYCYEEVRAHTFQNRIMSLLGKEKYQKVLDKEIARITAEAKKSGGTIGDTIASRVDYDEDLTSALGQPASKAEKDFLGTSVWIHAVFVFMDNNLEGDVEDQKALFLRVLYKNAGII